MWLLCKVTIMLTNLAWVACGSVTLLVNKRHQVGDMKDMSTVHSGVDKDNLMTVASGC